MNVQTVIPPSRWDEDEVIPTRRSTRRGTSSGAGPSDAEALYGPLYDAACIWLKTSNGCTVSLALQTGIKFLSWHYHIR